MRTYQVENCDTGELKIVQCATNLGILTVNVFNEYPDNCWKVIYYLDTYPSAEVVTLDVNFKSCVECLDYVANDGLCKLITEDDVNLTLKKVMTQNEPLLSVTNSVIITDGNVSYTLYSYFFEIPQNYIGGYLDFNGSLPMQWANNFPQNAVNNNATISTSGNEIEMKLPNLINWRYFQSLQSLVSLFGTDATNDWLWYQENGWELKVKVEVANDVGTYVDEFPLNVRDYDDNNLIDWSWEFFRKSDGAVITSPISGEISLVKITGDMPLNTTVNVDYSTVTVEDFEQPTRWVISSVYDQIGQTNSPLQPNDTETRLKQTNEISPNRQVVLEFDFDPTKLSSSEVNFTVRAYQNGAYTERSQKTFSIPTLPIEELPSEFPEKCCTCGPELKLASFDKTELIFNDITGVVHKNQTDNDSCEFKIYKDGVLLTNVGVDYPNGFPYDSSVVAFIYNWKHYLINNGAGCYTIEKVYTIAGLEFIKEIGHYELQEYTPDNAKGTARILYQNNFETLFDETTINYTDSGFEDSYRFRGMFGRWQPNVFSESNFSVRNENRVSSIKSKDTYLLNHFQATECHIERIHKIVMHATLWRVSDHNPSNTLQKLKIYECVLDNENREEITYNTGSRITGIEIVLSKRQQNSVSLFGGSVQTPKGATWFLPTVSGGGGGTCLVANYLVEYENGTPIESGNIPSGGNATIQVPNPVVCEDGFDEIYDTDSNLLKTVTIPSGSTVPTTIGNAIAVLKDTSSNTLSTTPILAEGSEDIVAPDGTVNIVDSNGDPIGSQTVASGGTETFEVSALPCSDEKEWILNFYDTTDIIEVRATLSNITTFTSGSSTDTGTVTVSTDGITYGAISYPFTPTVQTYYFKRTTVLVDGEFILSE